MTDAGDTKRDVAEAKLGELLDNPDTTIKVLPGGGVKVTDIPLHKRIMKDWSVRLQAATGVAAVVYLTIPQDTILGVIPPEYVAKGLLVHTVVTAFARMRSV